MNEPAVGVIDFINERIQVFGTRMQIEEAFLLINVISKFREYISTTLTEPTDDDRFFTLAIADREVLSLTSLWLGFLVCTSTPRSSELLEGTR